MGVYLSGLSDSCEEVVGFGHQSVEEEKKVMGGLCLSW